MLQDAQKLEVPSMFDALGLGPFWITNAYENNSIQLGTYEGTYFLMRTNMSRFKLYNVWQVRLAN